MQVIFCAEANPEIGVGHFMRCLALAQSFDDLGIDCFFQGEIREMEWVQELFSANTFLRQINSSKELNLNKKTVLVLDTYSRFFGDTILSRFSGIFTCAIVDNITPDFGTDISLHLGPITDNAGEYERFRNLSSGVGLIPIRREIKSLSRVSARITNHRNQTILLTLGGSGLDISNQVTSRLKLLSSDLQILNYTSEDVETQSNSSSYPNFLKLSNYVVSGGGYSMWESVYLNKHLAVIELAHNQSDNVRFAKEHQLAHVIAHVDRVNNKLVLDDIEFQKFLSPGPRITEKYPKPSELSLLGGNSAANLITSFL